MDDWQWAVRSDIQLQVLALLPFSIHDFTWFLVRLHFGAAALHRRLFLDCAPAAVSSLCSSPDQLRLRTPHFFPTCSGGKRLCLFGFVTMNTSAFSTLLLQGLVCGSVLTAKIPWLWKWAFQPRSWFCINQSERRLQCGAWGWWSDEVGQAFSPCVIVIPVLLRAAVASCLSFLPRFLSHSFIPTSLSHARSNLLLFLLLQKETHSIALHCWKGPGLTATSAIFFLLL